MAGTNTTDSSAQGPTALTHAAQGPTAQASYRKLNPQLAKRIRADRAAGWINPFRASDEAAIRRNPKRDRSSIWRPAYVRDVEKILHSPYYNRLADKTQVFSFYRNDDLTRRALHVQFVSRTARTIGATLGLNLDLIEAIALGHDIGHTPFGHAGERYLNELYHAHTGRFFSHNLHSVRVLDGIFQHNLSLQTLSGILCHNGEFGLATYKPDPRSLTGGFAAFDRLLEDCYRTPEVMDSLVAATLEGCLVRICDMVAYVGKDRQDVLRLAGWEGSPKFAASNVGQSNAVIINNLTVDIVEQSYGQDHLAISPEMHEGLERLKRENYKLVYENAGVNNFNEKKVRPLFEQLYARLREDLVRGDKNSYIWRHHLNFVQQRRQWLADDEEADSYLALAATQPDELVVDYIASMTDDYFVDLCRHLFPDVEIGIEYVSYFHDPLQFRLGIEDL